MDQFNLDVPIAAPAQAETDSPHSFTPAFTFLISNDYECHRPHR